MSTPLVSAPYVELTAHVMAAFGADAVDVGAAQIHVPGDRYRPAALTIEPDASSASYPLAMAAVAGGRVQVRGLWRGSAQGDAAFADLLGQMGCTVTDDDAGLIVERGATTSLRGIDVDMAGTSDLVPTLAAVAVTASSPTTMTGVGFIRARRATDWATSPVNWPRPAPASPCSTTGCGSTRPLASTTPCWRRTTTTVWRWRSGSSAPVVPDLVVADPDVVSKSWPDFWAARTAILGP